MIATTKNQCWHDSQGKVISQSADYKQVNVRCREDHKAQNIVEFDEEVYCNCNCFYKPNRIHAQTNQAQSHIFQIINRKKNITPYFRLGGLILSSLLWCMDVAKWAPHPHLTWQCHCPCVVAVLKCFFYIYLFIYFYGFAPTWLRLAPIRPKSGHIGWIRSYQLAIETNRKCNCNCFYKPNRIRAQTNQVRSHIFEIVNRKTTHNAYFGLGGLLLSSILWYMDVAKWAPYPHLTWWHRCPRVGAVLEFFFFLPIHANSASISANSARIGSYWPNQIVTVGN